jgi:hypothetical protein
MRSEVQVTIALLLLFPTISAGWGAYDEQAEPNKFFREYVGLSDSQIQAIRQGKALAKVLESRTPDEVFVFGSVYIEATRDSYLKLAFDVDALRKLRNGRFRD